MFKVYSDGTLIYHDLYPVPETQLVNPRLTLEANNAGSFEMTVPPSNVGYNSISLMTSTITVYRDDVEIWSGRPLSEEQSFYNQRIIYCEGELAYLNDTNQPQREYRNISLYQFIKNVLDIHNAKVPEHRRFYILSETVSSGEIEYRYTQFEKTLETINRVIEDYGGYVRIRKDVEGELGKRYLEFIKYPDRTSTQSITFGTNLLDFTRSFDMSELATVVLPLGEITARANSQQIGDEMSYENEPGNNVLTLNSNNDFVISPIVGDYFVTKPIDVGGMETVYISCRNHSGYGLYSIRDEAGNLLTGKNATTSIGMTDLVESKISLPPGSKWLVVSGFGHDLPIRVNRPIDVSENLDEYLTVEEVNDGSLYVIAESINKFKSALEQGGIDVLTGNNTDDLYYSQVRTVGINGIPSATEYVSLKAGEYNLHAETAAVKVRMFMYKEITDPDTGLTTGVEYEGVYDRDTNDGWIGLPMKIKMAEKRLVRFVFSKYDDSNITPDYIQEPQLEEGDRATQYESPLSSFDIYGWIEKQVTWDDIDDPNQLLKNAKDYLTTGQFDNLTLSVRALDMRVLGVDSEAIWVLDNVLVKSPPHGLHRWFEVSKLEIPLANPDQMEFTMGSKPEPTLTSVNNATNSEILNKIAAVPSQSATLEAAKENAANAIRNAMVGYVTTELAKDGHAKATYYTDRPIGIDPITNEARDLDFTKEPDSQAKGLLINQNGMAFYGNGFAKNPTIVLVNESGQIVANAIVTGTMMADRIAGGTLHLGDYDGKDGDMVVYDGEGRTVYGLNKTGYYHIQYDTTAGDPHWLAIYDGAIYGGAGENPGSDVYGHIYMSSRWTDSGVEKGISIEPVDILNITAKEIYLGNSYDPEIRWIGWNRARGLGADRSNAQVIPALNGDFYIDIRNGFIVGWDFVSKTPEMPYEWRQQFQTEGYTGTYDHMGITMTFENGLLKEFIKE